MELCCGCAFAAESRAANIQPCLTIPPSRMTKKNRSWASPSRDLARASPPSPLQTAAGCAAPLPSRRVARSLLADGGRPSGSRPGRRRSVERSARLRALDAFDDHRIVAHRTADKATLTGERRRRALAHHPYIALLVGLAPGVVVVVVHRVGHGAADDSPHPLHHPFAARVGITPRELHRCDVPAAQFAVLVNQGGRDVDAAFAAGCFEIPGRARVPESAATEMNADPDEAILVAQEIDVVIPGPDRAELRRRLLAI